MLINKNCYHALALRQDEYAYCKPIADFTLCGKRNFTFSIQFLPTDTGREIVLFSQEDVMKIGWEDGAFYYETKAAGTIMPEQWSMPVLENDWNQFDLICKDGQLTFCINGIEGYSEKITRSELTGSSDYQIGQVFEGYLRYVRIANFAMDQETLVANQYQNNLETNQMELYFDFSKIKARDLGQHNIPVLLSGFSEVKDIVRVFYPGKSGAAIPAASEKVNPGGFETGQFTIYQRVFLQYVDDECIVMANGGLTEGFVLAVTADCHMKATWNGLDYVAKGTLPAYQWLDLAVSYDGKTLRFYVNGEPDTEFPIGTKPAALKNGNIQFGNILVKGRTLNGKSFRGYFDCAAIFDMALEAKKLLEYVQQVPYIYEENLRALYRFQEQEPCEEINAGIVTLLSGAGIMFAENTMRVDDIGKLEYSLGKTKGKYTDFEIWEANTAAMVIASFLEKQTGIKPSLDIGGGQQLKGRSLDYVVQNVLTEPKVKMLLAGVSAIAAADIVTVLKTLYDSGKLKILLKTVFHASGSFAMEAMAGVAGAELAEGGVAVAAAAVGVAALCAIVAILVNTKRKNPPAPTPPKDKPKDKYRFLQVKTIQFRHSNDVSESAIPIVRSSRQAVEEPEWVSGVNSKEDSPSLAAYIKEKVYNVKLTVGFYYETNCNDSVTLNVSAEEMGASVLGGIKGISLTVSSTGEYEATVTLQNHQMCSLEAGEYASRYNWNCRDMGLIGVSYHRIYLLPKTPVKPWSVVKGETDNNVTVGALELFCKVTNENKNMNEAAKMVHFLLDKEKFRYTKDAKPRFTYFNKDDKVVLDQDEFDKAIKEEGKVAVNALDCSAIIVNHSALAGKMQHIMDIVSDRDLIIIQSDGKTEQFLPFLYFEKTMLLGEKEWKEQEGIDTHYVAADFENNYIKVAVYDGCMTGRGKGDKKIYAEGLLFSNTDSNTAGASDEAYYRETWFKEGCGCLLNRKYDFEHGHIPKEDKKSSAGKFTAMPTFGMQYDQIFITGSRGSFSTIIINALPIPRCSVGVNDRCHYISYGSICDGIANPINFYLRGWANLQQVTDYFNELRNAVFLDNNGTQCDQIFYYGSATVVQEIREFLANYLPSAIISNKYMKVRLVGLANELIYQLNNSINNLRLADASWNHSIKAAYDPAQWYYVNKNFQIAGDNTMLHYTTPRVDPNVPQFPKEGIYLPNRNDGRRLWMLLKTAVHGGLYIYSGVQLHENYHFVYSSNNQFKLIESQDTLAANLPIYYLYNNQWQLWS